jgi:hypothetical protein
MSPLKVTTDTQGGIVLKTDDHDVVADVIEEAVRHVPLAIFTSVDLGIRRPARPMYRDNARALIPDVSLILARLTTVEARELAMDLLRNCNHPTVLVPLLSLVMSE